MTSEREYSYPSERNRRPEDVEDIGMFPPARSLVEENPLSGLARRRRVPPVQPAPPQGSATSDAEAAVEQAAPTDSEPTPPPKRRDVHRGSTAMLPTSLVAAVDQKRSKSGLSAGSIVVEAIESHLEDLPDLLRDETVASTAGFRTREKIRDPHKEKTTIFAYRLSGADFANLDRLVTNLGARDRTHLMRTALTAHLKDEP